MMLRLTTLVLSLFAAALPAQERDIVVTGGWHMDNDSLGVRRPFARVTLTRR